MSLAVVMKGPVAMAGSIPLLLRMMGTKVPIRAAMMISRLGPNLASSGAANSMMRISPVTPSASPRLAVVDEWPSRSTCKAKIIEGEVEMVTNHALEDYEVEAGYVLTCQSYPVSEKIVWDYDQAGH